MGCGDGVQHALVVNGKVIRLGVIDDAIKHVRKSASEVNKKAKQVGTGNELNKIASRLEAIDNDWTKLEADLEDAKQQFGLHTAQNYGFDLRKVLQKER